MGFDDDKAALPREQCKASNAEPAAPLGLCRTYVQRAEVLVHPHVLEPLLRARTQLSTPWLCCSASRRAAARKAI
jgi:hypothetical protein